MSGNLGYFQSNENPHNAPTGQPTATTGKSDNSDKQKHDDLVKSHVGFNENLTNTNDIRKVYSIFSLVQELVNKNYSDKEIADYINDLIRKHNINVDFNFSSHDIKTIKNMLKLNQLSLNDALKNHEFKSVFAKIHILAVHATKQSLPQKEAEQKIKLLSEWLSQQISNILETMFYLARDAALLEESLKKTVEDFLKNLDYALKKALQIVADKNDKNDKHLTLPIL